MDDGYDVVGGYLPLFTQHLQDTVARLGLRRGSPAANDHGPADEEYAPADWSPAEQDAFFRAVSMHSRWRPDLIAACVPTRSEWEVWMYLEALEEGAGELSGRHTAEEKKGRDAGVGGNGSDVDMADASDVDGGEDVCAPPALEVSQDWIDVEERMAAWLIREERLTSVDGGDEVDDSDGPRKRKQGRPRGRRTQGRAQNRSRQETVSKGEGSPPPVHQSPSPGLALTSVQDASTSNKREALMSHLEYPHLQTLDTILRESEDGKSKSRECSVSATTPTELGQDGMPRVGDMAESSLSNRIIVPSGANNVSSDMVIDPLLLALSGGAGLTEHPLDQVSATTSSLQAIAQGPSPLPDSYPTGLDVSFQPGTSDTFVLPQDSVTPADPDPTANTEEDMSLLSPRTRRRVQKRLYMRRKRHRDRGGALEVTIGTGLEKLKPGRRAKSERIETSAVPERLPGTETPSDSEEESQGDTRKKQNQRGLTLPYKLKRQFAEMGVDAAYLRDQGMDLLHLGALGKLMGLYSSPEHGEEGAESIDAQVIRHLQAAIVSFVTDVIHRAIVCREREIRLKRRSRAWGQGDQITLGAVEHAVEVIGARYRSRKAYFMSLEATHARESSARGDAIEEPNATDGGVDAAADLPWGLPSPHRDVYTPLVYARRLSPLSCLARTYEREATRTRRGPSAEVEEEVMTEETDEEELAAALREEEEQEARDMEMSEREEGYLWDKIT